MVERCHLVDWCDVFLMVRVQWPQKPQINTTFMANSHRCTWRILPNGQTWISVKEETNNIAFSFNSWHWFMLPVHTCMHTSFCHEITHSTCSWMQVMFRPHFLLLGCVTEHCYRCGGCGHFLLGTLTHGYESAWKSTVCCRGWSGHVPSPDHCENQYKTGCHRYACHSWQPLKAWYTWSHTHVSSLEVCVAVNHYYITVNCVLPHAWSALRNLTFLQFSLHGTL